MLTKPIETISRGILSFAPLAVSESNETFLQGIQSLMDLLDLLKDKKLIEDRPKFALKLISVFQLFLEMNSNNPKLFVVRLELIKFVLNLIQRKHDQIMILLAPLVYAIFRSKNKSRQGLLFFLMLHFFSLLLTKNRCDFEEKRKQLVFEGIRKKPIFDFFLRPSVDLINRLWKIIPLINQFNVLDYYIGLNDRLYYYFESAQQ